ncbi:response regulator [Sorangium sp. So ce726]|uniref:response regulator n=1 Tax=Sorangium sp. So ce726 TaxID=3133319 RepID=UPI003F5F1A8F
MMVRTHWDVLIVDDDPDMLAISRLALKHVRVFGIPLKVHECTNKADAIKFLKATAELSDLSVALIDVVMETEHAGLDVCKFIREDMNNRVTPIVVRTGQPGKAPEREVIERYDISTYLTKVEATNEKLHATVVNAVRHHEFVRFNEGFFMFMAQFIPVSETRERIVRGVPEVISSVLRRRDGSPLEYYGCHFCLLIDGDAIAIGKFAGQEAEARALRDRLSREPSQVINHNGDRFMHAGNHVLISRAATADTPAFDLVGETNYNPMPDYTVRMWATFAQCISDLILVAERRR